MRSFLFRFAGMAAVLGGLYLLIIFIGNEVSGLDDSPIMQVAPILLLLLTISAADLAMQETSTRGVKAGLIIIGLGSLLMALGMGLMAWFNMDAGWYVMSIGLLLQPIGWLLFGFANRWAQILPRWNLLPFVIGAIMTLALALVLVNEALDIPWNPVQSDLGFFIFLGTLSLGWIAIGISLLANQGSAIALASTLALSLLLLLLTAVSSIDLSPAPAPHPTVSPTGQIIFYNGTILTMDEATPQAEAIAITGEKITAVGSDEDILAMRQPDTAVVDLQGLTLMPGFVDAHTHLFNDAEQYFGMSLSEVQQVALENGITTNGDLFVNEDFLADIEDFYAGGQLRIRTNLYLVATDNCGREQGDWWRDFTPTNNPGEMLRMSGVKLFADGGTCGAPALSYELRPGEGLGDLFFEQDELNELVASAHNAGYQVAIHAIGDRGVEQAQEAIAAALASQPNTLRHRIEHNSVIRPELLSRYGEFGIVPVIFGQYPVCDPFGPPPPPEYRAWEWPWRALLDANPGLPVAWHGDDPFFGRVRPLDDLYSLATRNEVGSDGRICEAPDWQKAHTIAVAEALPMMTIHAAYALFRDQEVGSLAPGKYADLIVLSGDPLTVDPEEIPHMDVLLTMVGGRVEFCAPGHEPLCP